MNLFRVLPLALPLLAGCASSGSVTRMVAGHPMEGRFIADSAYAAYLRGVVLETQGQLEQAAGAYEEALRHDPDSAELWTRVGALRCAGAPKSEEPKLGPWDAFSRAAKIDPEYEETWSERARCHLRRGQLDLANGEATKAIALDPNRPSLVILLASILERQEKLGDARRWLDGLVVREPDSLDAQEAMAGFAARTRDTSRHDAALAALSRLRPTGTSDTLESTRRPSLSDIDGELLSGNFERARRSAISAHLPSGALALRAAALGLVGFAAEEATLVLAADPNDADARIAAAVAADLARDDRALSRALSTLPASRATLSPLATLLLGELLGRRVGPAAEKAWKTSVGGGTDSSDPLAATVAARSVVR